MILFVLLLWAIWWYNSGNEGRLGNENNETPAEQKPQRAVIELTDNVDNQSSRGGTLKETTLKENELDATAGDDVEAAEEATSKFDCHDISIETFEENTTSPVALVEPIEPTRPLPRGAKKAVQNASNRKSQFCRMRGEVCGCADCEAEEHAVKMAWKYRKTIKKLKAELEARSSIAKSMRAEEHQKYQGRIAVLEAALADAENDVDAAYNEPMIGPDRSANHTSAMTMRLQLRKALHQNELLEKKRDDDSRKLQKILKDLENAQRTISDLKEATIISNNEIDSRDEKIKALLKEAEAVKGIRRTMEDEITHQKRQLQAAEETHREACESISRGSKDLQQTWAEKSKEDETTQEKLRKSIEYLRSSLRDADASQKISQTTIDNLRTTLTIVEASNAEHVRELTKTRQTAEALEKGYKFEISGLKGLLEERQTQGTLQTQVSLISFIDDVLLTIF